MNILINMWLWQKLSKKYRQGQCAQIWFKSGNSRVIQPDEQEYDTKSKFLKTYIVKLAG